MGGSRGGELALNLASRYKDFTGVIAMSASNVSSSTYLVVKLRLGAIKVKKFLMFLLL
jgi:pimeloyl-ACP methyl ester carboxylesterase